MITMESRLRKEVCELKKIIAEASKRLKTAPEGHLRIAKKKNSVEYYYKSGKKGDVKKNGRYMKRGERNLAKRIAQKDYDTCVIKNAEERIKAIEMFLEKYEKTSLERIYKKTNLCRRELIEVPVISDEEFIKRWQAAQYKGKMFSDNLPVIITERGERVRSKSEKIIADKLYMLGIPYRYEHPVLLEGNIEIYPDFTILKMPERKEVYLEHFGMMDDANYVDKVMYKMDTYERNGIYLGINLFITYETSKRPLNTKILNGIIKELFCAE